MSYKFTPTTSEVTAKSKIKAIVAVVCNVGSIAVENGCSFIRGRG